MLLIILLTCSNLLSCDNENTACTVPTSNCESSAQSSSQQNEPLCEIQDLECFDPSWQIRSENYIVQGISSNPQEPHIGKNNWVIQVTDTHFDMNGKCHIYAYLKLIDHNIQMETSLEVNELNNSQFKLDNIQLSQSGIWRVEFDIVCGERDFTDQLSYTFWLN